MLAALGMFVFDMSSAPFDALERQRAWRFERKERFGTMPASQYVGPGDDKITISGTLVPEVAGSYGAITKLAAMADAGEAYPLSNGAGTVFGNFTIDSIEERFSAIIDNGLPRVIGFSIALTRVS